MTDKKKWCTILIIAVVVIAAAVISVSEMRDGSVPTWDALYSTAGLTEAQTEPVQSTLTVHFIDVGQGDSILVQTPQENMLIDAGDNKHKKPLLAYLDAFGVTALDYAVATHPHSDHIGSMDDVLKALPVRTILMPRLSESNTPANTSYQNFLTAVQHSGAKVMAAKPGMTFSMGQAEFTVLGPVSQAEDINNMSVVLRLDWGETSFLFTGDAETGEEKEILNGEYADYLDADVLKLGHHGSTSSSSKKFLQAVDPTYGIISCGVDNDYGHPHRETLDKAEKMGIQILRTDEMGSIRFTSDGQSVRWESEYE
ncbi:MAG: ComEC/Rec2 family competence protein [Acutalibacteraceae bacterium]